MMHFQDTSNQHMLSTQSQYTNSQPTFNTYQKQTENRNTSHYNNNIQHNQFNRSLSSECSGNGVPNSTNGYQHQYNNTQQYSYTANNHMNQNYYGSNNQPFNQQRLVGYQQNHQNNQTLNQQPQVAYQQNNQNKQPINQQPQVSYQQNHQNNQTLNQQPIGYQQNHPNNKPQYQEPVYQNYNSSYQQESNMQMVSSQQNCYRNQVSSTYNQQPYNNKPHCRFQNQGLPLYRQPNHHNKQTYSYRQKFSNHQNQIQNSRSRNPFHSGGSCQQQQKETSTANKVSSTSGYRCEPCDRNFTNDVALKSHLKGHSQCEHPGCNFVASSKALKLHFVQKHAEGRFRIVLQTPEEIQKWRDERKRNWPSFSTIEAKRKKAEEKKISGIQLHTEKFAYRGNQNKAADIHRGNKLDRSIKNSKNNRKHESKNMTESHNITDNCPNSSTAQNRVPVQSKENSPNDSNGLSLLQGYKGDESDDGGIEDKSRDEILTNLATAAELEDGELVDDDVIDSEISKSVGQPQEDTSAEDKQSKKNFNSANKIKRQNQAQQKGPPKKVSLLEMLLAKEIRHERNVILQCVRHIVNENFFE